MSDEIQENAWTRILSLCEKSQKILRDLPSPQTPVNGRESSLLVRWSAQYGSLSLPSFFSFFVGSLESFPGDNVFALPKNSSEAAEVRREA